MKIESDNDSDDKLYKNAIRRAFSRSRQNRTVRSQAIDPDNHGPRGGKLYICNTCGETFSARNTEVDHIHPVTPTNITSKEQTVWQAYKKTRCNINNLQILCKECHKIKSGIENAERRQFKKDKKKQEGIQ